MDLSVLPWCDWTSTVSVQLLVRSAFGWSIRHLRLGMPPVWASDLSQRAAVWAECKPCSTAAHAFFAHLYVVMSMIMMSGC